MLTYMWDNLQVPRLDVWNPHKTIIKRKTWSQCATHGYKLSEFWSTELILNSIVHVASSMDNEKCVVTASNIVTWADHFK